MNLGKNMNKLVSIILAALFIPAIASAEFVRVSYSGIVDEVSGGRFGYAVGDPITGWFRFDTDNLNEYIYGLWGIDSNTGDRGYGIGMDDFDYCIVPPCISSDFYFRDGAGYDSDSYYVVGGYYGEGLRYDEFTYGTIAHWITGYTTSDGEVIGSGMIEEDFWSYRLIYGMDTYYYEWNESWEDRVSFQLTSFSASVPEPGTLALFGIGLLGMGMARRKKKV
jgi:hypothetical protein